MNKFKNIKQIPQDMIEVLDTLGYTDMTPIQNESIPLILDNHDILAKSKTGSGKTLAFGIPSIIGLDTQEKSPKVLIITPTRELAQQIALTLREISSHKPNFKIVTIYGGESLTNQANSISKGANILIGTVGRILDHLSKDTIDLDNIDKLILDEADRMLDMGFYDDIIKISHHIPSDRQTLLFSASFSSTIEELGIKLLNKPKIIKIDTVIQKDKIEEILYQTNDKFASLSRIIKSYKPSSLLIFCNTKIEVTSLSDRLYKDGHFVIDIQGDLDQQQRDEAIILFSNGSKKILVATDVASRGIDIKDIELVVNYDLPFESEVYTHRIGRTGRADSVGMAISLVTPSANREKFDYILSKLKPQDIESLRVDSKFVMSAKYDTIALNGGKKTKLRAGDIIGTLCKNMGLEYDQIGKIDIRPTKTYIALEHKVVDRVLNALRKTTIKKKKYIGWLV